MKRSSETWTGFNLPKRWVIHTVAVSFLNHPDPGLVLAQAIDAALRLANEQCIQLAMPATEPCCSRVGI